MTGYREAGASRAAPSRAAPPRGGPPRGGLPRSGPPPTGLPRTGSAPRPPAVAVPSAVAPEVADIALGTISIAIAVAARIGSLAAHAAQSAIRPLPVLRVRVRWAPLDAVLRVLDDRGRFERAVFADRVRGVGAMVIPAAVRQAMARIDVTALVREFVDIDEIAGDIDVDAIAARIDLDAIIDRLDLIGLARYVVDGIDLSELVRESTGSVTTEMVRSMRVRSLDADEIVERTVDRLLLRRGDQRRGPVPDGGSTG